MEFLIKNIIQRMDALISKPNEVFSYDIKSFCEDNDKDKEISKEKKQKDKDDKLITINCSFKDHANIEAISYCLKCKVYMCDKCIKYHDGFFENHPINNLEESADQNFTGFCQEENHNMKLEYFCKTHNKLCCGLCLSKIKGNGNGQHNDCDICFIKDIKEEKRSKLKDNIKELEELSKEIGDSIDNLKKIFEKANESKENIKLEIKKIFERIRNELNDRVNILLSEVDKYFDNNYCTDIIKKNEEIKSSIEKRKKIDYNEWDNDNKLNRIINDCVIIENNLKDIKIIKPKINELNLNNKINFKFNADVDNFIDKIKTFGYLSSFDSLILKNQSDINIFNELIDNNKITNNMSLLYRSSRDGFDYLNIVNKINNKSNLLFLYLTGSDRIFGAFIETKLEDIDLNGSKKYYKDENAFVFSLNNNKIYKILVPQNAIAFDNTNYILIGNNENNNGFYFKQNIVYDECLINEEKIYDFSKNSELTEDFGRLLELEIFEVNLN